VKKRKKMRRETLQTFVISPKEKTTVWVKQNVNFFQQNGSVIKIEQN
jgi:ribosomal protein S17